jgi:hypothetical protein
LDLNEIICPKSINFKYDLVTNWGMGEHIFNQNTFFKNVHDLTKKDGYMVHMLPFRTRQNHCFYLYTETFIKNLINENEYKLIYSWNIIGDLIPNLNRFSNGLEKEIWKVFLIKKLNDKPFKTPFQRGNIFEDDNKLNKYKRRVRIKDKIRIKGVNIIRKIANIKI